MPLTKLQQTIAKTIAANRSPDSHLAGGAALHSAPQSKRYSNDLDYFHDSEQRVASAYADDRRALEEAGFTVAVQLQQPGFVRAIVSRGEASTKVEWAHDSAWRFMPPVSDPITGFQLHPVDLAINKLLALVGRDEPRDFLDVVDAHERILPLGAMVWAAPGKDPGFTPFLILDLLARRGKNRPEDFQRLHLAKPVDVVRLKRQWLEMLDQAREFVQTRPADDLGCLYCDPNSGEFIQPEPGQQVVPHHGRPGGVVPTF